MGIKFTAPKTVVSASEHRLIRCQGGPDPRRRHPPSGWNIVDDLRSSTDTLEERQAVTLLGKGALSMWYDPKTEKDADTLVRLKQTRQELDSRVRTYRGLHHGTVHVNPATIPEDLQETGAETVELTWKDTPEYTECSDGSTAARFKRTPEWATAPGLRGSRVIWLMTGMRDAVGQHTQGSSMLDASGVSTFEGAIYHLPLVVTETASSVVSAGQQRNQQQKPRSVRYDQADIQG